MSDECYFFNFCNVVRCSRSRPRGNAIHLLYKVLLLYIAYCTTVTVRALATTKQGNNSTEIMGVAPAYMAQLIRQDRRVLNLCCHPKSPKSQQSNAQAGGPRSRCSRTYHAPVCPLLRQILAQMSRGGGDTWTGWVEMQPVAQGDQDDTETPPDANIKVNGGGKSEGSNGKTTTQPTTTTTTTTKARLQVDLRFAPMDA